MIQKIFVVFIGSLLMGIGINGFLVPYHLIDGGIIGISLILHYYFDARVGLTMMLLSIPLFLYTWLRERLYFYHSLYGLFIAAFFIDWLAPMKHQLHLPILASALLGGTFIGLGTGLMLRYQTSTGGTDLLAKLVSNSSSLNIGIVIFIIDGLIVTAGYRVLGLRSFLFSCIAIITVGVMSSLIIGPAKH
ncbi:YitT family protein [Niallia endozanthoxylica]|uniref:YitT family protein n=1 Tax=Niallia endozanthoxylica TaxID=2036016 RepID=A0A5J5HDK3_9BACI|nr:YitT family protein [Niallia endozanthoxylica]